MAAKQGSIKTNLGRVKSDIEKLIQAELTTYLGRMFSNAADFTAHGRWFDIIVGTAKSNPLIAQALENKKLALPTGKNANQGYTIKTIGKSIYIAGRKDIGVLYGVYALLEEYGTYFQISGERLPKKTAFAIKQINISVAPVFKYRGILPWDNFLDGMSGYNLEDYQQLINHAVRMKLNMLQFHFYPKMAFFTETWNGKSVDPKYVGMPGDVFYTKGAVGKKAFGDINIFGPDPYVENMGNPRAQAESCQEMMRQALDYARARGMKTVVGYELLQPVEGDFKLTNRPKDNGLGCDLIDPLDRRNVKLGLQRFRMLTETYPQVDYYWLWEGEGQGVFSRNADSTPAAARMRKKYEHWAKVKDYAGDIDYAFFFREIAKGLPSEMRARLATGGWNLEHIFPGADADFPREVIFASLNGYDPKGARDAQVPRFRVAKSGRRAWMIDWWEFDGNAWFPEFKVEWQEAMYRQCQGFGVEGVSLLGWKLSAIEQNVRYLADFPWRPQLAAREFYAEYLTKLIGKPAAVLADNFMEYDRFYPDSPGMFLNALKMQLGIGWDFPILPKLPETVEGLAADAWRKMLEVTTRTGGEMALRKKLAAMDAKSLVILKSMLPKLDAQGKKWAEMLINRFEFRIMYIKAMLVIDKLYITYDKTAPEVGFAVAQLAAAEQLQISLRQLKKSIEIYAQDIRNRNDLGVIAQLNIQYYQVMKKFCDDLARATGK
jgi:hypothetical protein